MRPLLNNVLIKPDPAPEKTEGGVHIPDSVQQISDRGEVIAVGPGAFDNRGNRIPVGVEKGERVLFRARQAPGVTLDGELHIVLAANQVLSAFEEGDEEQSAGETELVIVKQ